MPFPRGPGEGLRLGIQLLNEWCHFSDPHYKGLPHFLSHLFALKESFLDLLTMDHPPDQGGSRRLQPLVHTDIADLDTVWAVPNK